MRGRRARRETPNARTYVSWVLLGAFPDAVGRLKTLGITLNDMRVPYTRPESIPTRFEHNQITQCAE